MKESKEKRQRKKSGEKEQNRRVKVVRRAESGRREEVISIGLIAISVLAMLSMYTANGAGIVGLAISSIMEGMFGLGGYGIPIIIMGVSIYSFFEKGWLNKLVVVRVATLLVSFISLVHISTADISVEYGTFLEYIGKSYENGGIRNGGLIGAIFGNFFVAVFGEIGTYVVLGVMSLIVVIVTTEWSFLGFMGESATKMRKLVGGTMESQGEEDEEEYEEIEYSYERGEMGRYRGMEESRLYEEVMRKPRVIDMDNRGKEDRRKRVLLFKEDFERNMNKPLVNAKVRNRKIMDIMELHTEEKEANEKEISLREVKFAEKRRGKIEEEREEKEEKEEKEREIREEQGIRVVMEGEERGEKRGEETGIEDEVGVEDRDVRIYNYNYEKPPTELLDRNPTNQNSTNSRTMILENSKKLESTLKSFGVAAKVVEVSKGPTVTRYELSPGEGVKVSKISGLADDLALSLAAQGIRIEAPIPGKSAVGIEVPNKEITPVYLREVIEDEEFEKFPSKLAFGLGKDIAGNTVVADIAKMPHLLIAGATGSGKSVCINTLITSIIYKSDPNEVKLLMIDPKVVELSIYNGIPHLMIPVVTDPKKASGALNWAVSEMIKRYNLFAETAVRDLRGYNNYLEENEAGEPMAQIVIIIDELSDLMMAAPGEVEDAICRLAQMARAAGIHLIIATQRPSVDVITGLIKANIPSRLAFSVSSGTDSRTILDMVGAEKLLGKGDMLFCPVGLSKPLRVQGAFISDKEVEKIVSFVKQRTYVEYDEEMINQITAPKHKLEQAGEVDELFEEAVEFVIRKDKVSIAMLQKQLKVEYNRAASVMKDLETNGIVGIDTGGKLRKVMMGERQWQELNQQELG